MEAIHSRIYTKETLLFQMVCLSRTNKLKHILLTIKEQKALKIVEAAKKKEEKEKIAKTQKREIWAPLYKFWNGLLP